MSQRGSLETAGARLQYLIEGQGETVLIIGSATYYPRTFAAELREHCRLVFMDVRHFAQRAPSSSAAITLASYLQDIEAVCETLSLQDFTLLGHSHHGNLALEYAKRHPQRVARLALVGTPPANVADTISAGEQYWQQHASAERKATLLRNQRELEERLAHLPPEAGFVARYVAEGPKYWYYPDYDASELWRNVPINVDALQAFKQFFVDYEFNLVPQFAAPVFVAPVFVAIGKYDFVVPPTLWSDAARASVRWHLFEHSGHTPQLEEPSKFNKAFLDWFRTDRRAAP